MDEELLDEKTADNVNDQTSEDVVPDPWHYIQIAYEYEEAPYDGQDDVIEISYTDEDVANARELIEENARVIVENKEMRVLSTDLVYNIYGITADSPNERFYEFKRILQEYSGRFIAGHFAHGSYFQVIAMSDPVDFDYADQLVGYKGSMFESLLKGVYLSKEGFPVDRLPYNKYGGMSAEFKFDKSYESIFVFYADEENDLLRFITPMYIPAYAFESSNAVKVIETDGAGIDSDTCLFDFMMNAIYSDDMISEYIDSLGTNRLDKEEHERVYWYMRRFCGIMFVTLPDYVSKISRRNVVGIRCMDLYDKPLSTDASVNCLFSDANLQYLPDVSSLGYRVFDEYDVDTMMLVSYAALVNFSVSMFKVNFDATGHHDEMMDEYAHTVFIKLEAVRMAAKMIVDRFGKYWDSIKSEAVHSKRDPDTGEFVCDHDVYYSEFVASNSKKLFENSLSLPEVDNMRTSVKNVVQDAYNCLGDIDFNDFYGYVRSRVIGHDEAIRTACYYIWYYLKSLSVKGANIKRDNFIISGGSGCGKTEFMRAVKDYISENFKDVKVPVTKIDSSIITQSGYKGVNFEKMLYQALFVHTGATGVGIVFLDEFDKKLIPAHDSTGDDTNAAVQNNLLTALEGADTLVISDIHETPLTVNTRNTLFIALGTFDSVRSKHEIAAKSEIGFTSSQGDPYSAYWKDITQADIIEHGATEELLGRFSGIVNFKPLNDMALKKILHKYVDEKYLNATFKIAPKIHISRKAEDELIEYAKGKRGVRDMFSKLDDMIRPVLIDIISSKIDVSCVKVLGNGKVNYES